MKIVPSLFGPVVCKYILYMQIVIILGYDYYGNNNNYKYVKKLRLNPQQQNLIMLHVPLTIMHDSYIYIYW